jgi:hypothetical protein
VDEEPPDVVVDELLLEIPFVVTSVVVVNDAGHLKPPAGGLH